MFTSFLSSPARRRDLLAIMMMVLSIFLCGYGVGFLLGDRADQEKALIQPGDPDLGRSGWVDEKFEKLRTDLALTDEQGLLVRQEIESVDQKIRESRFGAIKDNYVHLLQLHENLLPILDQTQRERVEREKKLIRASAELTFPELKEKS